MVTHSVPFSDCETLVQIITAVTTGEVCVQLFSDEVFILVNQKQQIHATTKHILLIYIYVIQRPEIPESCPDILRNLMTKCWEQDPKVRLNVAH